MAVIVFHLSGVSEEEADAVRELLLQHELPVYETSAGRWYLGVAAIWIKDDARYQEARELIDAYQLQRQQWFAQQPPLAKHAGWQRLRQEPVTVLLAVIGLMVVLGLSVLPLLLRAGSQ